MIAKTQAVVLRYAPFSETSRMVTWFTADHGKITTAIKGSQRPKSFFLGQYDLFYTCELLFYEREHDEVHAIRECSPLNPRLVLREDWRACALASYLADLFSRISPDRAHEPGLFELLEHGLDHCPLAAQHPGVLFWFELKLLQALGLAPRLQAPAGDAPRQARLGIDLSRGGRVAVEETGGDPRHLCFASAEALGVLAAWQSADHADAALKVAAPPARLQELAAVMDRFLEYHLETPLRSRRLAMQALRYGL